MFAQWNVFRGVKGRKIKFITFGYNPKTSPEEEEFQAVPGRQASLRDISFRDFRKVAPPAAVSVVQKALERARPVKTKPKDPSKRRERGMVVRVFARSCTIKISL